MASMRFGARLSIFVLVACSETSAPPPASPPPFYVEPLGPPPPAAQQPQQQQPQQYDCYAAKLYAGESICSKDPPAIMNPPEVGVAWLTMCYGPNGTPPHKGDRSHRCDANPGTPVCIFETVNGRRRAACCPAGIVDATHPSCRNEFDKFGR